MQSLLILAAIVAVQIGGDYFVKISAEHPSGLTSYVFIVGAILYGATSIGWYFLMRRHSLAEIGVLYSTSTIILLAALGHYAFKEDFGFRQLAGVLFAICSVFIMR